MSSLMEQAKKLFDELAHDKPAFLKAMTALGYTRPVAFAYWVNCNTVLHPSPDAPAVLVGHGHKKMLEKQVKRTIVLTLEIEVEEYEDTWQTAELAVELLNGDMNNQITLIAASDKKV